MERERRGSALIVPVLMLAFACAYGWSNRHVPPGDMHFAWPLTIGLGVLSLVLIGSVLLARLPVGPALTPARLKRPVLLFLCTLILLGFAGYDFPLATTAFLLLAIPLMGYRRWVAVIPVAVVLPVLLYWGFTALGVPLASFWLEG
ncbi:tripartite tricarboxylate transporter TctB family protein [Pseudooceanicola nanhaiensis]|uniref:tripartite tricarboxylate transporter TctB family protein n=1 Tax=Pseudooceanicola nanhaiensis TaxID=375761 RepID=UPI001CD72A5E|nr:tripartite tricarboxylate transporter TctB family protein [Pseudooceanicola nanhaiensis]MCA0920408.1 tripartite tricarboxylate transporter TctB family protein [Pseudooceanicola nanhaiensis]